MYSCVAINGARNNIAYILQPFFPLLNVYLSWHGPTLLVFTSYITQRFPLETISASLLAADFATFSKPLIPLSLFL